MTGEHICLLPVWVGRAMLLMSVPTDLLTIRSVLTSAVESEHLGEHAPPGADLGPGPGEPTQAVAPVEVQLAGGLDAQEVGLAVTAEVPGRGHLGEHAPPGADLGPGPGEPTQAVAPVEVQLAGGLDAQEVGLAVTAEVPGRGHLGEHAPPGADLGPDPGEPAQAVAPVEVQLAGGLDAQEVGLAVTAEVPGRGHLGEHAPPGADLGPGPGEPTQAVAPVEVQLAGGLDAQEVGLAVTAEVPGRGHLGEHAPPGADLGPGPGEPTQAVAPVEVQLAGGLDAQEVGLAVTAEVPGRGHLGEHAPPGADLGPGPGEPTQAVAPVEVQLAGGLDAQEVGLAVTAEVPGREHLGEHAPPGADLGPGPGEPAQAIAPVEVQLAGGLDAQEVGLAVTAEVPGREHLGEHAPPGADLGPGPGEPAQAVAPVQVQVAIGPD